MLANGNQAYNTTTFKSLAAGRHVVVVDFYRGWQFGSKSGGASPKSICDAIHGASLLVNKTKIFSYSNMSEIAKANIGTGLDPFADKVNAEKWGLYLTNKTGTPVDSVFNPPNYTRTNQTLYTAADTNGKHLREWFADYTYARLVAGDGSVDNPNLSLDGTFNDNIFSKTVENGDYSLDGSTDTGGTDPSNSWLRAGLAAMITYEKSIWGASKYVIGNIADWSHPTYGANLTEYVGTLQGGVMEHEAGLSYSNETVFTTAQVMAAYQKCLDTCDDPKYVMFHHDNLNLTTGQDYLSALNGDGNFQAVRAIFAQTTMKDGYYTPTTTTFNSQDQADFDEMDGAGRLGRGWLGYPLNTSLGAEQVAAWSNGIWRRDFDNGIVLWCPKGVTGTVSLGGTYYRLTGTQDSTTNSGASVTSVTFSNDRDGLFLSRNPT